jgi:hypothetical protein
MKRPASVRVLGREFAIAYVKGKPLEKDELGEVDLHEYKIAVRDGLAADKEKAVALHEVVHAIDDILELNMTEKQVNGMENGLFAFLRENPRFINWLRGK